MDIKELLIQYKQLLNQAEAEEKELSEVDVMEELGVDLDTVRELELLVEKDIDEIDDELVREYEEPEKEHQHELEEEEPDLSIEERPYIYEEEIEEEESELEEESTEYYEDMNETQLEEIEAAAEAEAEREQAAKEKAEKAAVAKKKKEQESRKQREEELRKKAEEANKIAPTQPGSNDTTPSVDEASEPVPVVPVVDTTTASVPVNTAEESIIENDNSKSQGFFNEQWIDDKYGDDYWAELTTFEKGRLEEAKRQEEEAKRAAEAQKLHSAEKNDIPPAPQPVTSEQPAPVVPPVPENKTPEPVPVVPVSVQGETVQTEVPAHNETPVYNQPVIPASGENIVPPVQGADNTSPIYDHNQMVSDVENTDYSKAHQYEQNAAQQAAVNTNAESGASRFQQEVPTNASDANQTTQHVPNVAHAPEPAPESSYYTPAGVPVSVEARVPHVEPVYEHTPIEPTLHEPIVERARLETAFNTVYANYEQDVSVLTQQIETYKAQLDDMKERGVSQDVISAVQADLDYNTNKLQSMQSEKAHVEEAINNGTISAAAISYIPTARVMLEDYERETFDINKQINEYRRQLDILNKESGSIVEKASVQAEIDYYTERLETIGIERKEIVDTMYTTSPAKSIVGAAAVSASLSIYDRDVSEISRQIQESKAQLAQMKDNGASASEIASVKADIDYHSGRLRDIKTESQRVAIALRDGTLSAESVSFIPAAKSLIDAYDKETWEVTKQLTEAKTQLNQMKSAGAAAVDRMNIEKEIDKYTARLQDIRIDRKIVTDALYEGAAPLKDAVYMSAAKSQLVAYERETFAVTKELVNAKQELVNLKNNPVVNKKAIASAEAVVARHQNRLTEIQADRVRITDYLKNGPRRISREDVTNSEYSRNHRAEMRQAASQELPDSPTNKLFNSNSRMQQVHKTRMQTLLGSVGDKTLRGAKRLAARAMEEDEDLANAERITDETRDVVRIVGAFKANSDLSKELRRLGLDKASIQRELENIGVITGVGDVTKMSIKQLKAELVVGGGKLSLQEIKDVLNKGGGINIPYARQKQLLEAIELKEKLYFQNTKIASFAERHAGEYIRYSKKRLLNILKDENLSIDVRSKAELALQYKKLSKMNIRASGRWRLTVGFVSGVARKMAQNNEYLADIINMGNGANTAYRIGRTTYNIAHQVATGNKVPKRKLSSKVQKILDEQNKLKSAGTIKSAIKKTSRENLKKAFGIRAKNLVQAGHKTGAAVQGTVKGGAAVVQKISAFGAKVVAGAKAAIAAIGSAISAVIGAVGGALGIILVFLLIAAVVVALIFSFVMGSESNETSVPEMVEYLEEKNEAWRQEIQELVEAQPVTLDKHGDRLDEYTKVHYTYYDASGNVCMVTDNTKEIISMAAVYFRQDFSDKDKVYEYLDEVWEKSHIITTSETAVYDCHTDVCFDSNGDFVTDAQGFNGHNRTFYCSEDYTNISYNDCYKHDSWNAYRQQIDKNSFRFSNDINYYTKYDGISNILTTDSTEGYGCSENFNTFYCTSINSITNSEVLVRLVQKTGIPYYTLISDRGCIQKHSTDSEGSPRSDCYDYSVYYKTFRVGFGERLPTAYSTYGFVWDDYSEYYAWEYTDSEGDTHTLFIPGQGTGSGGKHRDMNSVVLSYDYYEDGYYWYKYSVPYYTCDEKTCNGHSITYHSCSGHDVAYEHYHNCNGLYKDCPEHIEKVCHGHVDLNVNLEIRSFDGNWLFMTHLDSDGDFYWDDPDDIEWAINIRDQNWKELYGVEIPSSLFPDMEFIGASVMPSHPNSLPIPLYNQMEYNTPYGVHGTVASHGCGITCIAMVAAYHKGEDVSPALLGRLFGNYNTPDGSLWSVFADSAPELHIPFEKQSSSWAEVVQALQDGKPVISIQNENGPFTTGGHFILLTGITADGRILVNDPNGYNYSNPELTYGFANGFTQDQILMGSGGAYWIYGAKVTQPTE